MRCELSPLFSNAAAYTAAEQKNSFSRLALDSGSGSTDEHAGSCRGSRQGAGRARATSRNRVADLVTSLNSKLAQGQALQAEYEQKLASAKVELGAAIDQERVRRAKRLPPPSAERASAAAGQMPPAAASRRRAPLRRRPVVVAPSSGHRRRAAVPRRASSGRPAAATRLRPTPHLRSRRRPASRSLRRRASWASPIDSPPSHPALPSTVRASPSTPGAKPACRCLTNRVQQYASIPHISQGEIQPGDLLFYGVPIGHVGIYVGGGAMIDAPRPGEFVRMVGVNWATVVGIGRPG